MDKDTIRREQMILFGWGARARSYGQAAGRVGANYAGVCPVNSQFTTRHYNESAITKEAPAKWNIRHWEGQEFR